MAHTQVSENCIFCGDKIEPNSKCYLLEVVEAVKYGIREGNFLYNPGEVVSVKEGKLRIKRFGGGKKGLIHMLCFDLSVEGLK